jgi:hypothetical protein
MISDAIKSVVGGEPVEKKWKDLDENALAKLYGLA